jgi:hypothetical protein
MDLVLGYIIPLGLDLETITWVSAAVRHVTVKIVGEPGINSLPSIML